MHQGISCLQEQSLIQQEEGTYVIDRLLDQLTMLANNAKCLPILLLPAPRLEPATKATIVIQNCNRFLKGAWQSRPNPTLLLTYLKAMNLLSSPGLVPQQLDKFVETLQTLHQPRQA